VWSVVIDGQERWLSDLNIELVSAGVTGKLRLAIASETDRAVLELDLFVEEADDEQVPNYRFVVLDEKSVQIRRRGSSENIAEFFYDNPPIFWFADGSSLEGNQHVELKITAPPFDRVKIERWKC
jgi:hypothetical protein